MRGPRGAGSDRPLASSGPQSNGWHWPPRRSVSGKSRRKGSRGAPAPGLRVLRGDITPPRLASPRRGGGGGRGAAGEQRAPGERDRAHRDSPAATTPPPCPPGAAPQAPASGPGNPGGPQYLEREAPPCGAGPAAPRRAAASYCDRSPGRRASSPPEPALPPRRCGGAALLPAPSHGRADQRPPHARAGGRLTPGVPHPLRPRAPTAQAAAPPARPPRHEGPARRHSRTRRRSVRGCGCARSGRPGHSGPPRPLGGGPRRNAPPSGRDSASPPRGPAPRPEPLLFPSRGAGAGPRGSAGFRPQQAEARGAASLGSARSLGAEDRRRAWRAGGRGPTATHLPAESWLRRVLAGSRNSQAFSEGLASQLTTVTLVPSWPGEEELWDAEGRARRVQTRATLPVQLKYLRPLERRRS